MSVSVMLQLAGELEQKVRRIAAAERRSVDEMVRVLTEEAIKLREFPEIVFTDGPTGRRATFRDGLDVWEILEPHLVADKNWTALRDSYPQLDEARLREAVRYYESYLAEIEARVALNQAP